MRQLKVGDSFSINTPSLSARGVVTKINRRTIVYDVPYMVCPGVPDGWLRGLKISIDELPHIKVDQPVDRAAVEQVMQQFAEIAQALKVTAEGLRVWQRNNRSVAHAEDGVRAVHPMHAANRLDKLAERISASKKGETK